MLIFVNRCSLHTTSTTSKGSCDWNIRWLGSSIWKIIRETTWNSVGFGSDHVSVSQLEIFEDAFDTALIPTQNIVEKKFVVKDEGEIQTICGGATLHFRCCIPTHLRFHQTRCELRNPSGKWIRLQVCDLEQLEFHIWYNRYSGVRSSMPHGVASAKALKLRSSNLDFGCYHNGYVSDMTRTIAVGEPIDQLKDSRCCLASSIKSERSSRTWKQVD